MKKILVVIGIVIIFLIVGFYWFNSYIYKEKQGDGSTVESYRGTLSGEVVCLPHVDTEGPTTTECAQGIRTEVGEYYALDFVLMSQEHAPVVTGDRLSANGLITPLESLSSDHWKQYDIEGIFSVTDSVKKL